MGINQIRSDETVVFCRNAVETNVRFCPSEIDAVRIDMDSQGRKRYESQTAR